MKNRFNTPLRMCVLCREMKPKRELLRLVSGEDGWEIDVTGKKDGRGCYICGGEKCLAMLSKPKVTGKIFKGRLSSEMAESIKQAAELLKDKNNEF